MERLRTVIFTDFKKFTEHNSTYNSKFVFDVLRIEGGSKLYKGFQLAFICSVPENIVIVTCFALLNEYLKLGLVNTVLLSSLFANTLLYPLNTILVRYQADSLLKNRKYMYNSVGHLLREIKRQEGIRGYYKGFLTATMTNSLVTLTYMGIFRTIYKSQAMVHN